MGPLFFEWLGSCLSPSLLKMSSLRLSHPFSSCLTTFGLLRIEGKKSEYWGVKDMLYLSGLLKQAKENGCSSCKTFWHSNGWRLRCASTFQERPNLGENSLSSQQVSTGVAAI